MEKIKHALLTHFDRHRIVFWYDDKKEFRTDFETLQLPDIEKIELTNNEFTIKYRLLRRQPDQKFLVYRHGPSPGDLDNWLLDIQLAHTEFRTDQVSIRLSELELGHEFIDIVTEHMDFFNASKRRTTLKNLLKPDDTPGSIREKMLAVCVNSGPRQDEILESLLEELAENRDDKIKRLQRSNLEPFLREQLKHAYGYQSDTTGIADFAGELFKACYAMGTGGQTNLTNDALVFMKHWKNNKHNKTAFETLSHRFAELLDIERDLDQRDYRRLSELDYFELIDKKILADLVKNVSQRTISADDCAAFVRHRRRSHWYDRFQHLYQAVDAAARFIHTLNETDLSMTSMTDGIQRYSQTWFKSDQLYRKFIYHVRKAGQPSLMGELTRQIENLYSNNYLMAVNDNWQRHVDAASKWEAPPFPSQKDFYDKWVRPFPGKDKKICVIVSDAFRFEIGDELMGIIRRKKGFEVTMEPALSMLPSYTQLGMAALLPNSEITIADDQTGTVFIDGQSSRGTANRKKILDNARPGRAVALQAEELQKMNRDQRRALIRAHDIIYIFHNRIDAVGDKRDSEDRVFEAVEATLSELDDIITKLSNDNTRNLLVTADHGFIYQNHPIDESDFSQSTAAGEKVLFRDRRFILGKGLTEHPGLKTFHAADAGLTGDMEVQIPKSINRLRLKGSGSRYVHGGSSLQEVVVPVMRINKKDRSDISVVEVNIHRGATSVITTGQLSVVFSQSNPVDDKVQPRTLEAGIYTQEGELISDTHKLVFDLTSQNPREREINVRFVLTRKADSANGQDVVLRLNEKIKEMSHPREYKSVRYLMRRSFTTDFDF